MKIHLLSDLHIDIHGSFTIPSTDADIIVLAGDIHEGTCGLKWAADESQRLGKPVIYIAGNHEFYGHDIYELTDTLRNEAQKLGITFLANDSVTVGGVRFFGCTLWTDYLAWPQWQAEDVMHLCQKNIADYRLISAGSRRFSPEDALSLFKASRDWLRSNLESNDKATKVVITHHAPSLLCRNPSFDPHPIGAAFFSALDDLVGKADLWLFGHTHACMDSTVAGTRTVSNQRGYPYERTYGFKPDKVIEVDTSMRGTKHE